MLLSAVANFDADSRAVWASSPETIGADEVSGMVGDLVAREEALGFMVAKGVSHVFLFVGNENSSGGLPSVPGNPIFHPTGKASNYETLIADLHGLGIEVYALIGGNQRPEIPSYTDTDLYVDMDYLVDQVKVWNNNHSTNPDHQFDGINLDVEPWAGNGPWFGDPTEWIKYLNFGNTVMDTIGSTIPVGPFTFHGFGNPSTDFVVQWNNNPVNPGSIKQISEHLLDTYDYLTVGAFRDTPIELGNNALDEIEDGNAAGKPVLVGVETTSVPPNNQTFFQEGEAVMETVLAQVKDDYLQNPQADEGFAGFAIQDLGNYLDWATPPPTLINFNDHTIDPYSNQDKTDSATVEDAGATLVLTGNTWKKIGLPYTITPNTVLEFDFQSDTQGEIHGIGFDTDDVISSDQTFNLYGTQTNFGLLDFHNYASFAPGTAHYTIPVGQSYTGAMNSLFFANDHDVASPNAHSRFSNIVIYEDTGLPASIRVTPRARLVTTETGGQDSFNVVLNTKPTDNVTIGLSSSNTGEGTVSPSTLTFTPDNWYTPQAVTVTGIDDSEADGDQTYTIITDMASSGDSNYNGLNPADVTVTNTNDDAGIMVMPTAGLVTTEAGGQDDFTVVLKAKPTADVMIGVSSSNTDEGTVSTPILTFTPNNWDMPQTVTVTGVNDSVDDDDQPYTIITDMATSADLRYDGLDPDDVAVTNTEAPSDTLNFNDHTIDPYSNQDINGTATIEDAGATLVLTGNTWKKIGLPYNITPNTVLEFDFQSDTQGEIHGIGFDTDDAISSDQTFNLYGTQTNFGLLDFHNYASFAPGTAHYTIPVGQSYTGAMNSLFFANDHDVASPNAHSRFSNIKIYEDPGPPPLNFNDHTILPYSGSTQDINGTATIEDAGATLALAGNTWKRIFLPYNITPNTVLEFDFQSDTQGEIHGIGFDTDDAISQDRTFKLYGTQDWGITDFNNYAASAPGSKHYTIPVGQFYTGVMNFLTFTNDHDVASPNAHSRFSNIVIYEDLG